MSFSQDVRDGAGRIATRLRQRVGARMGGARRVILTLVLLAGAAPAAGQTYEASQGFYANLGVAAGWNNLAAPPPNPAFDAGGMVGFSFGAGYRFTPWIAVDAEFLWLGAGDLRNPVTGIKTAEATLTSIGVAAKLYPLALAPNLIPQWVQPYVAVGIGNGIAEQNPVGPLFGSTSETVFLTRVGGGIDLMFTEHWGSFADGSYYVTNNQVLKGIGTMKVGLLYRF